DGQHEAIISVELWEKVQAIQKERSHSPIRNRKGNFLLTGLMKCPMCGARMVASRTTNILKDGTKKKMRYYSCGNTKTKGSLVCHANSIQADKAEQYVLECIQEVVEHPKILEQLVSSIGKKKRECVVPLTKEKEMIEQKIQKAET